MANRFISRAFTGRRQVDVAGRLPPGQYITPDFPILSAGPTPRVALDEWQFRIEGLVTEPVEWSWEAFLQLPSRKFVVDIHCVTKWSKLDTHWEGVSVDTLLESVAIESQGRFATVYCYGGYTTNLSLADLTDGKAFVAYRYGGQHLAPEHGGPARLVVPHLYFWKSAKWVNGIRLMDADRLGFWESLGYHHRGDPWQEQRYRGD